MSKKFLHCMVGLPRSGKSTKAREMGFPIVNPDWFSFTLYIKDRSVVIKLTIIIAIWLHWDANTTRFVSERLSFAANQH